MAHHTVAALAVAALLGAPSATPAAAHQDPRGEHLFRVPQDHPTIQDAVNAARDGDRIVVARGRFCGATIIG